MTVRIEVHSNHPAAGQSVVRGAANLGVAGVIACRVVRLYFLAQDPGAEAVARLCDLLLADPVTERWEVARGEGETRRQGDKEIGRQGEEEILQSPISNLQSLNPPIPQSPDSPPHAPRPTPPL
jgi:phosphoribosylformylglycinamidine (FGAM) synthase PurS component